MHLSHIFSFPFRVWLSSDRANQSSMMQYAQDYLDHGIQVCPCISGLPLGMMTSSLVCRLEQLIWTQDGQLVITTLSLTLQSIPMPVKWYDRLDVIQESYPCSCYIALSIPPSCLPSSSLICPLPSLFLTLTQPG